MAPPARLGRPKQEEWRLLLGQAKAGAQLVPSSSGLEPSGGLGQVILQGLQGQQIG